MESNPARPLRVWSVGALARPAECCYRRVRRSARLMLAPARRRADRGESSSRSRVPALSGLSALRSGSLLPSSFASHDLSRQRIELRFPE